MTELVRIEDGWQDNLAKATSGTEMETLEGVIIETGTILDIFGGSHSADSDELKINTVVAPRDEWAQSLVKQNLLSSETDLSIPVDACRCQTEDHIALVSARIIKETGRTELITELPYPLTDHPVPNRFDPYTNATHLNDSGLRLAYQLFDQPLSSVSVDRYSVIVQLGRAIGTELVQPGLEESLRASGCSELIGQKPEPDSGSGFYL